MHNAKRAKLVFLRATAIHRRRAMLSFFSAIPFLVISVATKQFDGDADEQGHVSTLCFFILIGGVVSHVPNLRPDGVEEGREPAEGGGGARSRQHHGRRERQQRREWRLVQALNQNVGVQRAPSWTGRSSVAEEATCLPTRRTSRPVSRSCAVLRKDQAKVLALFKEWDEDGDGTVSKREFRRAMPLLGLKAPREHLDALFDSAPISTARA